MKKFKWFRKWKGGIWYKHKFTNDATQLTLSEGKTFWANYGEINRYSKVIEIETY